MPFTNGTATYQLIQFDTFNRLQNSLSVALIRLWFGLLFFSREFCPLHTFVVFQFFIHRNNWTGFHHFWQSGQTTSKLTFSRNRIRCTLNSIFALCFFFFLKGQSIIAQYFSCQLLLMFLLQIVFFHPSICRWPISFWMIAAGLYNLAQQKQHLQ